MHKTVLITGGNSGLSTSPEKCAETSIYLVPSPEVKKVSGKYFEKKKEVKTGDNANTEADNKRLGDRSINLAKLN